MSRSNNQKHCPCRCYESDCYECTYSQPKKKTTTLSSDCVVVESLLCSKKILNISELAVPIPTLGEIISIGPGGVITPAISLTPHVNEVIHQTTVVKDMIIITGYLPASVTILGVETPLELNIPFQSETHCDGVCAEDNIKLTPFKIEASVTQGIEALGVSLGNILFKVIMSTNLTATRPIITKADDLKLVRDVNEDRCHQGCYHD